METTINNYRRKTPTVRHVTSTDVASFVGPEGKKVVVVVPKGVTCESKP